MSPSSREPTPFPTTSSPTYGSSDTANTEKTLAPTPLTTEDVITPKPTCPQCIIYPDDLKEDKCPIATDGTCGDGDRGDGKCPFEGYCCSKWGYCGTTPEYCEDDSAAPTPSIVDGAPPAPTFSVEAGMCGAGNGDLGDGFCPDESLCCSDWGYCGSGELYCFTTSRESSEGTCGAGGVGDGMCADGHCCSEYGFCGEGDLYCTGYIPRNETDVSAVEAEAIIKSSPLPEGLVAEFGFRCGVTEVDARSNCKKKCTHHVQCADGEECWGIQLNYCNTFEEGEHPVCTDLDLADNDARCGVDETSARSHCGPKCESDSDCPGPFEFCYPTLLNLCQCHETGCPEESAVVFAKAKALISDYFAVVEGKPEGMPRNSSFKSGVSVLVTLVSAFMLLGGTF